MLTKTNIILELTDQEFKCFQSMIESKTTKNFDNIQLLQFNSVLIGFTDIGWYPYGLVPEIPEFSKQKRNNQSFFRLVNFGRSLAQNR